MVLIAHLKQHKIHIHINNFTRPKHTQNSHKHSIRSMCTYTHNKKTHNKQTKLKSKESPPPHQSHFSLASKAHYQMKIRSFNCELILLWFTLMLCEYWFLKTHIVSDIIYFITLITLSSKVLIIFLSVPKPSNTI
jgi:hypothetical protein